MCSCSGGKAAVPVSKVDPQGKWILTDSTGKLHEFKGQDDAYFARAKLGGTVNRVPK